MKYLLVGNPNTGKTTFFNTITKSDEHVGNWHGVTVEGKTKKFKYNNKEFEMTDLPGTYSLTSLSFEEQVTIDNLLDSKDKIINICDINNLENNLYLTLQLIEAKREFVIFVNDTNSKNCSSKFNHNKLCEELGVNVEVGNAQKKSCKKILNANCQNKLKKFNYFDGLEIEKVADLIKDEAEKVGLNNYWCAIKLFENDDKIAKKLKINENKLKLIKNYIPNHSCSIIAKRRHEKIKQILKICEYKKTELRKGLCFFDKIATNKYLGVLLFFAIMFTAFYLTFFLFGSICSEFVKWTLDNTFSKWINNFVIDCPLWIRELVGVGIVGGLESLLGFLPQIVLLFLFLSILEETGYMSRVAFLFDDIFAKIGLSGKSAYTLIMGFGCSTTAIMTARNMEDKNSQIKTALLAPYMSCSAKLPIYLVIGGAFFGKGNIFNIFFLYLLGIVVSIFVAIILNKSTLKSNRQSFVLEFPDYKFPSIKKILKIVWKNFVQFLIRVGTVLIFVNIIVWVLQSFTFDFKFVSTDGGKSMLESLGGFIAPIFTPLGFGNWGAVSALLAGFVAKEVIISSIAIFNGFSLINQSDTNSLSQSLLNPASAVCFTPASCFSYLVFCLLYCPCLASLVVLKKEVGAKWMWIGILFQLIFAYIVAFVMYTIFLVFTIVEKWKIICAVCLILIVISPIMIFRKKKSKCDGNCKVCGNCR